MTNVPYVPAVPAWATNVCALSTSLIVSVPLVLISEAKFVSVKLLVSALNTAESFVPRILIVTVVVVPSALATLKVSV